MYLIYKLLRSFIRSLASTAAPWQIGTAAALGIAVGFLPVWPWSHGFGPAPLGCALIAAAFLLNCHLATFFLLMGVGKLLGKALAGPALALGDSFEGLARASAEIPLLHASLWSHTGWLGLSLIGLAAMLPVGAAMWALSSWFHRTLVPRLRERQRLLKAGQALNRAWLVRLGCWFFGL